MLAAAVLALSVLSAVAVNSFVKRSHPIRYEKLIYKYAEDYGVSPVLILAVIKTESDFDPEAISSAGAKGLMQITDETFDWLMTKTGEKLDTELLYDPDTSIKYGSFFLKMLLDEFQVTDTALAAYNAGRGRINGWLADSSLSPDGKTLSYIPISETRYYVYKVNNAIKMYESLYNLKMDES